MIRHCLRLIWNRKRTNLLLAIEIFFSFLVTAAVVITGSHYVGLYRQPLGFTIDDVWVVSINTNQSDLGLRVPAREATSAQMLLVDAAVREFSEVVTASRSFTVPYKNSQWIDDFEDRGRHIAYNINAVTDGYREVLGLRVTRGRWFSAEHDALTGVEPTVITERFAKDLCGSADPIGKVITQSPGRDGTTPPERRVIGVVEEHRRGDFEDSADFAFVRHQPRGFQGDDLPLTLLVKTRPGTTAAFEERLARRLHEVAPGWSFQFQRLDELKAAHFRDRLGPIVAEGIIAAFLLLMVALGLTGVLWQAVTQRTREIGLRRASGAAARQVRAQILLELTILASVAIGLGLLVVVQVPLLEIVGGIAGSAYVAGLVISAGAIYLLTIVCAWYPGRLAAGIPPAEALRYE